MTTHTRPQTFAPGHLSQGGGLGLLQGQRNPLPPQAKGPASSAFSTRPKPKDPPRERHRHDWREITTCGQAAGLSQCADRNCLAIEATDGD